MAEKCDDCCLADSNGVPCYLMFREGTNTQLCTRHVGDQKKHDKIVADLKKAKDKSEKAPEGGDK